MATVTIRNLDDRVVKQLKERARRHNRSFEAELREVLTRACTSPSSQDLRAIAERIAAMTPDGVAQTDSTELLREDRER
ncbi:MAG: hypothetical protein ACE5Q3_19200 [Alphaproteobacteria bacterium]